jgi:hypothetical protein
MASAPSSERSTVNRKNSVSWATIASGSVPRVRAVLPATARPGRESSSAKAAIARPMSARAVGKLRRSSSTATSVNAVLNR